MILNDFEWFLTYLVCYNMNIGDALVHEVAERKTNSRKDKNNPQGWMWDQWLRLAVGVRSDWEEA